MAPGSMRGLQVVVDDIDEAFAGLVAHGATVGIEPIDSPIAGVRISYLVDPEGNLIELLEQRP